MNCWWPASSMARFYPPYNSIIISANNLNFDHRPLLQPGLVTFCNILPLDLFRKSLFWDEMSLLAQECSLPWFTIGDFNDVISPNEKKGGNLLSSSSSSCLANGLQECNLIDIGFKGNPFTWNNKRLGDANIQERLNRAVANERWINLYPQAVLRHVLALKSNHRPLLLETNPINISGPKPFIFLSLWLEYPHCKNIVSNSWKPFVPGSAQQILVTKTRRVKKDLKDWNNTYVGRIPVKISQTMK